MKMGSDMPLNMAQGNGVSRSNMFLGFIPTISFSPGDIISLIPSPKFNPGYIYWAYNFFIGIYQHISADHITMCCCQDAVNGGRLGARE